MFYSVKLNGIAIYAYCGLQLQTTENTVSMTLKISAVKTILIAIWKEFLSHFFITASVVIKFIS